MFLAQPQGQREVLGSLEGQIRIRLECLSALDLGWC